MGNIVPATGIIPAYAGSTADHFPAVVVDEDHPRVCGEHSFSLCVVGTCAGSSPRMRGALAYTAVKRKNVGIIPAYAGSTQLRTLSPKPMEDHPRVCGEHYAAMSAISTFKGSSPRMRGARPRECRRLLVQRIIPAYAGSTFVVANKGPAKRDHPRVCGEHKLL